MSVRYYFHRRVVRRHYRLCSSVPVVRHQHERTDIFLSALYSVVNIRRQTGAPFSLCVPFEISVSLEYPPPTADISAGLPSGAPRARLVCLKLELGEESSSRSSSFTLTHVAVTGESRRRTGGSGGGRRGADWERHVAARGLPRGDDDRHAGGLRPLALYCCLPWLASW